VIVPDSETNFENRTAMGQRFTRAGSRVDTQANSQVQSSSLEKAANAPMNEESEILKDVLKMSEDEELDDILGRMEELKQIANEMNKGGTMPIHKSGEMDKSDGVRKNNKMRTSHGDIEEEKKTIQHVVVLSNNTNGTRLVPIQELDPVNIDRERFQPLSAEQTAHHWCEKSKGKDEGPRFGKYNSQAERMAAELKRILYIKSNLTSSSSAGGSEAFYYSALMAYNNHQNWHLDPNDVWLQVLLWFTRRHVEPNAEALRSRFVSHERKQKLNVTTHQGTHDQRWNEFFKLILQQMDENTTPGTVGHLQADFSTTGTVEKLVSTATIMDVAKSYFSYGHCMALCGIANVQFSGTEDDWNRLYKKIDHLKIYTIPITEQDEAELTCKRKGKFDDLMQARQDPIFAAKYDASMANFKLKMFIDRVLHNVSKFIATYKGQVDKEWWNKIMNFEYGPRGSGSVTYISGWILDFYGLTGQTEREDITCPFINVPIELTEFNLPERTVHLLGGFDGIHMSQVEHNSVQRTTFRPVQTLVIVDQ
jgi:hypothetical protein